VASLFCGIPYFVVILLKHEEGSMQHPFVPKVSCRYD
jgi:hypothetical protein